MQNHAGLISFSEQNIKLKYTVIIWFDQEKKRLKKKEKKFLSVYFCFFFLNIIYNEIKSIDGF